MKYLSAMLLFCLSACADADVGLLMEQYLWEKRVLVVLTPSDDNADYQAQNKQLSALNAADLAVWRVADHHFVSVDGEHKAQFSTASFYSYFKIDPQSFTVILLGKDGEEKIRQNTPIDLESFFEGG